MKTGKKISFIILLSFLCGFILSLSYSRFTAPVSQNIWQNTEVDPSFIFGKFNSDFCLEKHQQFVSCINAISKAAQLLNLKPDYKGQFVEISENERIKMPIHSKEIKKWMIIYGKYKAERISFAKMFFELITKTKSEQISNLYAYAINGFLQAQLDPHTYIIPTQYDQNIKPKMTIETDNSNKANDQSQNLIVKLKNFAPETCVNLRSELVKKLNTFEPVQEVGQKVNHTLGNNHPKINQIVIDVSNNPGGKFDEVACVVSLFQSTSEHIFSLKYFSGEIQKYYTQGFPIYHGKLMIRINSKTASTAELFAGAMKYLNRAQIIGSRSFGKGTFQKRTDWQDQNGISLYQTAGVMMLPNNQIIQGQGILPNFIVPVVGESERESELFYNTIKVGDYLNTVQIKKQKRG